VTRSAKRPVLPKHVIAEVQAILDAAARRLLEQQKKGGSA